MSRKSMSKRTRFEVFKRDRFICQYCGAHPPEVVLEVDHIIPVAEGGEDDEANLITACFTCNRGKAAISLTVSPEALQVRAERMAEAEEQFAAYRALMEAVAARKDAEAWDIIEALFSESETTSGRLQSVKQFLKALGFPDVMEAAEIARSRKPYSKPQRFQYFCGVCWKKIKDRDGE